MSFVELEIKSDYDSEEDDVLSDFYIPVFAKAKKYDRLAGFFSSSVLAAAAKGIAPFIENGGHMRLVVGAALQASDVEAIKQGNENPEKILSEVMLRNLDEIQDEFTRNHVGALGWLVARNQLALKVAVVVDNNGKWVDQEAVSKAGIFHQKVGVFDDEFGNSLTFSGSVNESALGWHENIEEFKVFRSWVDGDVSHLNSDRNKFEKYWYGRTTRVRVFDVPAAVREKLIRYAPNDLRELKLERPSSKPRLRPYQIEAVSKWLNNNGRGIFEMGTGTGKTFVALGCLIELLKKESSLFVVISCPTKHLIRQWKDNLAIFGFTALEAFGSVTSWENRLANSVLDFSRKLVKTLFVITTHDTFPKERFTDIVQTVSGKTVLIADEVHGVGSPERQRGLLESYRFRMGLSATPERWFDEEGSNVIKDYFGKTIYEFGLGRAIDEGYLCKYEYHPYFVELTQDEFDEYERLTKKIAVEYLKTKDKERKNELLEMYAIKRHKVIVNAQEKFRALNSILDKLGTGFSHCLVYCSPEQIDAVQDILKERRILQSKFTAQEDVKERAKLLDLFSKGYYQALVAMKCLDEGVDVPATRTAIIMASSTNPREFIQRRGRILRNYPGKSKAYVHDIIVVPQLSGRIDPLLFELEAKMMKGEIDRYTEFARSAMNRADAYGKIVDLASKYKIILEEE